jgi:hypothetical protein
MGTSRNRPGGSAPDSDALTPLFAETGDESSAAWEVVDTGRYKPRRIRGSYRGRELG